MKSVMLIAPILVFTGCALCTPQFAASREVRIHDEVVAIFNEEHTESAVVARLKKHGAEFIESGEENVLFASFDLPKGRLMGVVFRVLADKSVVLKEIVFARPNVAEKEPNQPPEPTATAHH